MSVAPIVLFAYKREEHLRLCVDSLLANDLASKSELIVYCDQAANDNDNDSVLAVRRYAHQINGFKSVTVILRSVNLGLSRSIISGVTETLKYYSSVIVIEDDLVVSRHFLKFMNDGLQKYQDEERVISIHGYVYPTGDNLPSTFFLRGADCWGWATWSRAWTTFNENGAFLLEQIRARRLSGLFDFNGTGPFLKMLRRQSAGLNDSWAIRWYASAFLADKLTLYPGVSLVTNIGMDGSGTHCPESRVFEAALAKEPIEISDIAIIDANSARASFEAYFRRNKVGIFEKCYRLIMNKYKRK
ncbi:glycosyltransferase [Betaproteobacteria bacterium LSUCC0117]|nr:glycosyltransferase [Betaproteobacteria bacterium LSUCC0117]